MKAILFVILVSGSAFAEEEAVKRADAPTLSTARVLASGCPEYASLSCAAGERLDIERDSAGCNIVKCVVIENTTTNEEEIH